MRQLLLGSAAAFVASTLALSSSAVAASKSGELSLMTEFEQSKRKHLPGTDLSFETVGSYLFVLDQFEIGPALAYYRSLWLNAEGSDRSYYSVGVGPRAKFNLGDINRDKLVPYGALTAMMHRGEENFNGAREEEKAISVTPAAGLSIFLADNAALNLELGYQTTFVETKGKDLAGDDVESTSRNMDTNLNVGFSVFL